MSFGKQPTLDPIEKPPFAARRSDPSVLLAGLMGLRPQRSPATSTGFASGGVTGQGLGRRPSLGKRAMLGGL